MVLLRPNLNKGVLLKGQNISQSKYQHHSKWSWFVMCVVAYVQWYRDMLLPLKWMSRNHFVLRVSLKTTISLDLLNGDVIKLLDTRLPLYSSYLAPLHLCLYFSLRETLRFMLNVGNITLVMFLSSLHSITIFDHGRALTYYF